MRAIRENGWVEVISGSMFSGKTEELLRRLRRAEIAGQEVVAFTPAVDDRYGQAELGSHAGHTWEATVVDNTPEGVHSIPDRLDGASVVAIDEANFFPVELVAVANDLATAGRRVIVSGTDQTYRGEPFEPLGQLMATAEYVDKLRAICAVCGEPATRNQRLVDGEPAHVDEPTIVVGADESYQARCRSCHEVRTD
ncbi:thymidine kinase [Halodesulfurarchaeum sp. HSR-GB]|uniref:thymidine kinase n=1 Tax=Halodesulfurarchaeum sp. HSR-GB TaxID=3074077 RepID=UPI00285A11F1|nr:thymidine kinase [Halodesulfurarchaeum sp. HSR-GB]MDR5657550.1 thymidine kinase [Halodesulfurarchaeum sp. HSR-GB]